MGTLLWRKRLQGYKPIQETVKAEPIPTPVKVEPVVSHETTKVTTEYSKTEINRMSTSALQELATSVGIEGADEMTGAELKRLLIDKFDL